jgi:hypothetical protein
MFHFWCPAVPVQVRYGWLIVQVGALCPSKSGLLNKHVVKHIVKLRGWRHLAHAMWSLPVIHPFVQPNSGSNDPRFLSSEGSSSHRLPPLPKSTNHQSPHELSACRTGTVFVGCNDARVVLYCTGMCILSHFSDSAHYYTILQKSRSADTRLDQSTLFERLRHVPTARDTNSNLHHRYRYLKG